MTEQHGHEVVVSCRLAYDVPEPVTLFLNVAASTVGQEVVTESWSLDRDDIAVEELPREGDARLHRLTATPGALSLRYEATVRVPAAERSTSPGTAPAPATIDRELLSMLLPSRYAPADRVGGLARTLFGDTGPDATRVTAIADWIHEHVSYVSGSTTADDSALETVLGGEGVCRDFAHLTVAFARALDVPARYASVYAPLLDPPDFHAVAEVHLGGRWWVVDPTRLAPRQTLVRIGTGRDAADCAFATVHGGRVTGLAVEVAAHVVGEQPPTDDHSDLVAPAATGPSTGDR